MASATIDFCELLYMPTTATAAATDDDCDDDDPIHSNELQIRDDRGRRAIFCFCLFFFFSAIFAFPWPCSAFVFLYTYIFYISRTLLSQWIGMDEEQCWPKLCNSNETMYCACVDDIRQLPKGFANAVSNEMFQENDDGDDDDNGRCSSQASTVYAVRVAVAAESMPLSVWVCVCVYKIR